MKKHYFFIKFLLNLQYISLGLFLIFSTSPALAYTPPLGIPDPGMWGTTHPIDGVAPSTVTKCPSWPNAQATGCYYIDNTHPQATNTSNTLGYPNKPRLTLPATSFLAGSYVEMHGGPYTTNLNLHMNGTADNPVWFKGTAVNMPTFTNYIYFTNSTYLFVEYLDFNGGTNTCIKITGSASNNVVIRNSKFRNRGWVSNCSAVGVTPDQGGINHDIIFYNNEFSELGTWDTIVDEDFHAINPTTYGRTPPTELYNVWCLNNSFYHLSGNGVQVNAHNETMIPYLHHVYIGKNTGSACRQAILWSKQANHIIMSQNVAYDNREHGSQPGNGIGYQYNPDNLWIIFNEIYNSSSGIRQSDSGTVTTNHNVYILGNKIYNIHPLPGEKYNPDDPFPTGYAISFWKGKQNRYVLNNTIYDVNGAFLISQDGNAVFEDNIASDIHSDNHHVYNINAQAAGMVSLTNNIFFSNTTFSAKWGSLYTTLESFYAAKGTGANCIFANPEFTNTSTYDLTLQSTSPAIGRGSRHSAYGIFEAQYGINIDVDFNGTPRPAGAWTIGAFEPSILKNNLPAPPAPQATINK